MNLFLARFRADVTPPTGHPLCGGWIKPVVAVDDPLEIVGVVVLGAGAPIVIAAIDWCGVSNAAHAAWRKGLADAAHTTPDRVALQCVHQHNAPFVCLDAEALVGAQPDLQHDVDLAFFHRAIEATGKAIRDALATTDKVTHIATGKGRVEKVASNRRFLGADGKVSDWRGSASKLARHHELPEGLIDPDLRTVAFYAGDKKLAALHYYATHPMSYYGDGRVTSDFAGLARKRRQKEEPETTHVYFTGCAGNIAAGKYNDGTQAAREALTDRLYAGIVAADERLRRQPIEAAQWRTHSFLPAPRAGFDAAALTKQINDRNRSAVDRNRPAHIVGFLRRLARREPILCASLEINDVALLHLPAECFIEYQLRAQKMGGKRFVATAAYGDGGPWYIPTADAYPQGGYEVSVAFCDPAIDLEIDRAIAALVTPLA